MRVKICGVTSVADAVKAALLGADAIGFNFYPKSRRFLPLPTARAIAAALPPFVTRVGLWVNESLAVIQQTRAECAFLQTVQYHGDVLPLPPEGVPFIPAFPMRDRASLQSIESYLQRCREAGHLPAAILVDAHVVGEYGGTGRTAPWEVLADFHPGVPLILAGGLTPENVAEAVRLVRPYAVDVASGVESSPGVKDAEKMHRFIERARAAATTFCSP